MSRLLAILPLLALSCSLGAAEAAAAAGSSAMPLSLAEAYRLARERHPRIQQAEQQAAQRAAEVAVVDSERLPQIGAGLGYQHTDEPSMVFGMLLNQAAVTGVDFNDPGTADQLRLQLGVDYQLYDGTRAPRRSAAVAAERQAAAQSQATADQIGLAAVQAWLDGYAAQALIVQAEAAVTAFAGHLQTVEERVALKTALDTEALEAAVRLDEQRLELVRARGAAAVARARLARHLGLAPERLIIDDELPELPEPDATAAQPRPELAAWQAAAQAARQQAAAARASARPQVHLSGRAMQDIGFESDGEGTHYAVGLQLDWRFGDGGRRRAEAAAALAAERAARAGAEDQSLAIAFQRSRAAIALREARAARAIAERAVGVAEQAVEQTASRVAEGLALTTQLLDAEARLSRARSSLVRSRAQVVLALAQWRHALGLPIIPVQL